MSEPLTKKITRDTPRRQVVCALEALPTSALEFALAHGELAEAFEAARKHPETLGEELADVLIFLTSIAEMSGIDLASAVEAKMAKNEARRYERGPTGTLLKVDEES